MKFGFVTCVELGLSCMQAIYEAGGRLDFAITLPDEKARKKSGRVYIDEFCARHNIPLFKAAHINDPACVAFLEQQQPDWLFIIGWSQIADRRVLDSARQGVVGIHPTLLPEGRGRAAIPWAILKGLRETGVTMFCLDEGVDTGDILAQVVLPIPSNETATWLYHRVNDAHAELIKRAWPSLADGSISRTPQDHSKATVWPGRKPEDGEIVASMTVEEADRLVRAVTHPYPGAYYQESPSRRVRIWAGTAASIDGGTERYRLNQRDGVYYATEWEFEDMPRQN